MLYRHPQFQFIYKRPWPIRKAWLERKGFFKKLARYGAGTFLLAALAAVNIFLFPKASATFTYNATNNLGQDHGTHTTANYSDYFENDTPAGNHVGYDSNSDVTVDTVRHRMFVADTSNMRVMVYNLDSSNHFTSAAADYAIGQPDFANSNLPYTSSDCYYGFNGVVAAQNNLCQPGTLAFDSTNNRLFVGDYRWNRVMVFDLSGGISNNMNASYVLGQPDFTSSSCPGTPAQSSLCAVTGMFYDLSNQRLFVSDNSRSRVMVYDLSGGISNGMNAAHVLGQNDFVTGTADVTQNGLNRPDALTYDSANSRLFVGDDSNQRVMVFNLGSGITDGMNASNVLGQTDFTSSGCASPITQNSICDTGGLAYDSVNSRLSISDTFKYRVLTYNLSGGITNGMNASYEFGQADFVTFSGHGAAQNSVSLPGGLAYSGQELLVSDTSISRLLTFDMSGTITNNMNASHEEGQADYLGNPKYTFGASNNANPSPYGFSNGVNGIAEDSVHHRLYVGDFDNARILVYNLDSNNHLTGRAADYVLGQADFSTVIYTGCAAQNKVCEPIALAADSVHDRLFVSDWSNSRVMVFDFSGGISNNMNAVHVLGQPNFTTVGEHCNALTGQNNLCDTAGIAYDSNHDILYVSEEGNSRMPCMCWDSLISRPVPATVVVLRPTQCARRKVFIMIMLTTGCLSPKMIITGCCYLTYPAP
jgi:hypothetical protein